MYTGHLNLDPTSLSVFLQISAGRRVSTMAMFATREKVITLLLRHSAHVPAQGQNPSRDGQQGALATMAAEGREC